MELVTINNMNVWKIADLKVNESQKNFVESNSYSIIEAYATIQSGYVALPFGLYENDTPVGFIMIGYGTIGDEDEPEIVNDSYCIWRLMIDEKHQGKGLGKKAMEAVMSYLKTNPCGEAKYCWLSYEPENTVAKLLYRQFGFEETGEKIGDEVIAVCSLQDK